MTVNSGYNEYWAILECVAAATAACKALDRHGELRWGCHGRRRPSAGWAASYHEIPRREFWLRVWREGGVVGLCNLYSRPTATAAEVANRTRRGAWCRRRVLSSWDEIALQASRTTGWRRQRPLPQCLKLLRTGECVLQNLD